MKNSEILDSTQPIYSIGSAARLLTISVHTIRMYEKAGLIIPHKVEGKNRLYSELDIERLRCIRREINNKKYSISAIQRILSFYPCWIEKQCSDNERSQCSAYQNGTQPCWTYKHIDNICSDIDCYSCSVYRDVECDRIKEKIIKYTSKK